MAISEKSRTTIYQGLEPIIGEPAISEMLHHFPARDVDEAVTREYLHAEVTARFERLDDKLEVRFTKIDERFEKIDDRFESLEARFTKINDRFESLDDKLEARFEKIDDRFEAFRTEVHHDFAGVRADLHQQLVWLTGLMCTLAGVVVTVVLATR